MLSASMRFTLWAFQAKALPIVSGLRSPNRPTILTYRSYRVITLKTALARAMRTDSTTK